MSEKTDERLVQLARAGSKAAFGELITSYQPLAQHLAADMVGNNDIAQELAQESLLRAYLSLDHLRGDGRFRGWLCGIVLNVCRDWLRDQKTLRAGREGLTLIAAPDPHALAEEREQQRLVREAVESLSPENRAAMRRFYYEQWSLQEIASDLGISVTAVKGRLHKGRRLLRERLGPHFPQAAALPRQPRRRQMVKVSVAGVYLHQAENRPAQHFVQLADDLGRELRIWIGVPEAWAISFGLEKAPSERPMTMDLMVNLLRETGTILEEVRIESMQEETGTFYAVLKARIGGAVREVDARPSDAVALALRTGAPIHVADKLLDTASTHEGREYTAHVLVTASEKGEVLTMRIETQ